MKQSMSIFLTLILALSLASCTFLDELLSVNLFAESMELSASDIQSSSISELLAQSDSNAFYTVVGEDSAIKTALLDKTEAVISSGTASALAKQEAGILGANVLIYTSPAGDLLANATALADGLPSSPTMEDLLDLIMPDTVYSGGSIAEGPFVDMINAFVVANDYYIAIGDSLASTDLIPEGSAGDLAVGAFIAAAVSTVDKLTYPTIGDYLYEVMTGGETPPAFDSPDTETPAYGYLANILDAANLGDLLDL